MSQTRQLSKQPLKSPVAQVYAPGSRQTTSGASAPVPPSPTPTDSPSSLSGNTPQALTIGGTASPGISTLASRDDHVHVIPGVFGAAGVSHSSGFVPDTGSTSHGAPYVLLENGWNAQTAITQIGTVTVGVWNGTKIGTAYGGTNIDTSATVIGAVLYTSATGVWSTLAGPTSSTKQFLTSTGTGSAPQAPAWGTIAAADYPLVTTGARGAAPTLPNDATKYLDGTGAYSVPAGVSGINPTGYLDGCVLSWVSTTSVQVGTGSAYSTAAAALLTVSSPITFAYAPVTLTDLVIDGSNNKLVSSVAHSFVTADIGMELNVTSGTGFTVQHVTIDSVSGGKATLHASAGTLSSTSGHATLQMKPSTFYYVSLASNSTVSVSPTAPTNYQGTAWQDASTHRYVGAFLTDSSSNIYQWIRAANLVRYKTSVNLSPFAVLSAGSATTSTSVSCSGCVPPTSTVAVADIFVQAPVAGCSVYFGSSDGTGTVSSTNYDEVCTASASVGYQTKTPAMNLNTSQALLYLINNAGSALYLKILGYLEPL